MTPALALSLAACGYLAARLYDTERRRQLEAAWVDYLLPRDVDFQRWEAEL